MLSFTLLTYFKAPINSIVSNFKIKINYFLFFLNYIKHFFIFLNTLK